MPEIKVAVLNQIYLPEIVGYIGPLDTQIKGQFLHQRSGKSHSHRACQRQWHTISIRRFGTLCSKSAKRKGNAVQKFHLRLSGWLRKSSD